jgi:hypothetical protein
VNQRVECEDQAPLELTDRERGDGCQQDADGERDPVDARGAPPEVLGTYAFDRQNSFLLEMQNQ